MIADAGAYTGLSSAFFAHRFPEATVIAIEPGEESFDLPLKNVAAFPNVHPLRAALWMESGTVSLSDRGDGAWGVRVTESAGSGSGAGQPAGTAAAPATNPVRAVTATDVIREFGLGTIDLLKVDVEGSEKELSAAADGWIGNVDAICMELHDRFKPGCRPTFFRAVEDFTIEMRRGEDGWW